MVKSVEEKERIKKPSPPFTTSSLQQEASNKLGFYTKKTMLIAQQLYEGVEIKGHGTVGLVSYIRTDSVRINEDAHNAALQYIRDNYSEEFVGNHVFTNKKKDVQDAHEAIRPANINIHPEDIKGSVTKDQYGLYKLIWSRFLASRMASAVFDVVSAEIENGDYTFKATGSRMKFEGYLHIYNNTNEEDEDKMLPALEAGEKLSLVDLAGDQNFTQPPSRFTEASLVKDLEDKNIGRPSTYAYHCYLMKKIYQQRKEESHSTDWGFLVNGAHGKVFS